MPPAPRRITATAGRRQVNGATVKLTLNKDARWTKALKFMLADLKVGRGWAAGWV